METYVGRKKLSTLWVGKFWLTDVSENKAKIFVNAVQQVLLTEIKESRVTHVPFRFKKEQKFFDRNSRIPGIRESIPKILNNLKSLVFRGQCFDKVQKLYLYVSQNSPRLIIAESLNVPNFLAIVNKQQEIFSRTEEEPIDLKIDLIVENDIGERIDIVSTKLDKLTLNEDGLLNDSIKVNRISDFTHLTDEDFSFTFSIDTVFRPVLEVKSDFDYFPDDQIFDPVSETKGILFLDVITNDSLTPQEALQEANYKLINLFKGLPAFNQETYWWPQAQTAFLDSLKSILEKYVSCFEIDPDIIWNIDKIISIFKYYLGLRNFVSDLHVMNKPFLISCRYLEYRILLEPVSGLKKMKNKKFHLLKIKELKFSPEVSRILKESYIKNLHQILFFDNILILISLFPKKEQRQEFITNFIKIFDTFFKKDFSI